MLTGIKRTAYALPLLAGAFGLMAGQSVHASDKSPVEVLEGLIDPT